MVDDSILMDRLDRKYENLGRKWGKVAITLGFYPSYICDVRAGRRSPGPKLLKSLGLKKEMDIRYVDGGK
jgi:hypothetical protein